MTQPHFFTRKEALEAGWFSRRHETGDANRLAREKWRQEHSKAARQLRAADRLANKKEIT